MRNTIISIGLIVVIALCACSRAAADQSNLIIVNRQETAEVYSVAIETGGSTSVAMNANSSALSVNDELTFDVGTVDDYAFDVAVTDSDGHIACIDSFCMSFEKGVKQTLYIVADADGALRVTANP